MLDFIFRRGNPTNGWQQPLNLTLAAALDLPTLNGVALGSRLDQLSSLGRSDKSSMPGYLLFSDLGISIDHTDDGKLGGFSVVFRDEVEEIQPYRGKLTWKQKQLNLHDLTLDNLPNLFGDWYWLDTDAEESLAFFEYPDYEMVIEIDLDGAVKRINVTNEPSMADPDQREDFEVDKPWPPQ